MIQQDFQELKRRLAISTDFGEFWNYYFDRFAENPEFMELGRHARPPGVMEALRQISAEVLRESRIEFIEPFFTEIPECHLVHGAGWVNGRLMCMLWFSDVDFGSVAFTSFSGETTYARFAMTEVGALAN